MDEKSEAKSCPQCGAELPPDSPQGLCPRCLLKIAATESGDAKGWESDQAPESAALQKVFPELEIHELIGRGGMGAVYRATQTRMNRTVALKVLPPALAKNPEFAERFAREARALARLSHPNIVTLYDFGEREGIFYLLVEYVDGLDLRRAMKASRLTPAEALKIVPSICEALEYAHGQGVLHRDIKPANILLDQKGTIKLVDFGIAKLGDLDDLSADLTQTGGTLGTPQYMAPEQIENPSQVDHRADIYSLGVVLYEMLTGELPLGRFAPPSRKSDVDPGVDPVVLRALEKEREARQQSAGEMRSEVETAAGRSGDATPRQMIPTKMSDQPLGVIQFWLLAIALVSLCFSSLRANFGLFGPGPIRIVQNSLPLEFRYSSYPPISELELMFIGAVLLFVWFRRQDLLGPFRWRHPDRNWSLFPLAVLALMLAMTIACRRVLHGGTYTGGGLWLPLIALGVTSLILARTEPTGETTTGESPAKSVGNGYLALVLLCALLTPPLNGYSVFEGFAEWAYSVTSPYDTRWIAVFGLSELFFVMSATGLALVSRSRLWRVVALYFVLLVLTNLIYDLCHRRFLLNSEVYTSIGTWGIHQPGRSSLLF